MRTLYIECQMGVAGDMLLAALCQLLPDQQGFLARLNRLLPGVSYQAEPGQRQGISGLRLRVSVHGQEEESQDCPPLSGHSHSHDHSHDHSPGHNHDHSPGHGHHHRGLPQITTLLAGLELPEAVRSDALAVYGLIAAAEGEVHGRPVDQVHFHEVGALDAVADIVGCCLALAELRPERIVASPVCLGHGQVRCAHGLLPVPAPATAVLLRGLPCYAGPIQGELATPTGVALLRHFAASFGPLPPLRLEQVGYGLGGKDFPQANCVRVFLGESEPEAGLAGGLVSELCCNLDDMTGEDIGFAAEELFRAGALDVFTQAIQMKKQRPGVLLTCLCRPEDADRLAVVMLTHTSAFGLRRRLCHRYELERRLVQRQTPLGPVRVKLGQGYGLEKEKPEYEDLAQIARQQQQPLSVLRQALAREED